MQSVRKKTVLSDSNAEEMGEYLSSLKKTTGCDWELQIFTANRDHGSMIANLRRYVKYFLFPFQIFLNRKQYDVIIAWQAFYGIIFAFYCRLFHAKKRNCLVIQHFIYKPKRGITGKIYYHFLKYSLAGGYVDLIISSAKDYAETVKNTFDLKNCKAAFARFGVNDFTKELGEEDEPFPMKDYVLSVGRSNRDWDYLIRALRECGHPVIICCDELHRKNLPDNILIKNDVYGKETLRYMKYCKCAVIPIADPVLSSGETVLCQLLSLGKPVVITKPSTLADSYVENGKNGVIIEKTDEALRSAIDRIYSDAAWREVLSQNAREDFLNKHSLYAHGERVGKLLLDYGMVGEKHRNEDTICE